LAWVLANDSTEASESARPSACEMMSLSESRSVAMWKTLPVLVQISGGFGLSPSLGAG